MEHTAGRVPHETGAGGKATSGQDVEDAVAGAQEGERLEPRCGPACRCDPSPGPRSGAQQGGHGVALGAPVSRMLTCIWGVRGSDICGWSCVPPNPCVEAPNPNVTVFGDGTFKEVVEVK